MKQTPRYTEALRACRALVEKCGYEVIEFPQKQRGPFDLILRRMACVVFVHIMVDPPAVEPVVTSTAQQVWRKEARAWLTRSGRDGDAVRFDIMTYVNDRVTWLQSALRAG